ncbi:MAG: hypothetical protein LBK95_11400 [Bifidobacteriaceae bacterium]|nr:hypothetical protein [Bifidobacteriaceae bacterium]
MWFWLWTVLIVAWLVGVFFGLRWLWRQVKGLIDAMAQAGEAASAAMGGADVAFEGAPIPGPAIYASPEEVIERARGRLERIAARRQRRHERNQATYDSWAVLAGWRSAPVGAADPAHATGPNRNPTTRLGPTPAGRGQAGLAASSTGQAV